MSATPRADLPGLALLLLGVVGWGSNWPLMKLLLAELPPFASRYGPGLTAAALLLGLAAARGVSLRVAPRRWPQLALFALLNISAWMGLATLSLRWLSAGEGAIICYTVPVWTALLAWPLLGERPSPRRLLALALGLLSVVVVVAGRGIDIGLAKLPGVVLALAGSVLFALGTVASKRWPLPLPPLAGVAWQVAIGMLPLLVGSLAWESPDFAALSGQAWRLLAYMATVPLCLCYLAWFAALRRLPAALAAQGTLLAPIAGVAGAALLLGEPFGLREAAALGLCLVAVGLAARG